MFSLFAVILYLYAMYPSYVLCVPFAMYHAVYKCLYLYMYVRMCVCVGDSAVCHNVAVKFKAKQRCKNYGNCCKTVGWTM